MKAGSLDSVKSLSPLDVLLTPSRDARAADSFAQHLAAPERAPRPTAPATKQAEPNEPPTKSDSSRSASDDRDDQPPSPAPPSAPEVIAQAKPTKEEEADEVAVSEETADELVLTAVAAPVAALPDEPPPTPESVVDTEVAALAESEGKSPAKPPVVPTQNANEPPPAFELAAAEEVATSVKTPDSAEEAAAIASPQALDATVATIEAEAVPDAAVTSAAITVAGDDKTSDAKSARTAKNNARSGETEDVPRGESSEAEAAAKLQTTVSEEAVPAASKVREGRRERGRSDARNAAARSDAAEPTAAASPSSPATAPATAATTTSGAAPLLEAAPPVTDGAVAAPTTGAPPPTVTAESPAAQQRLPQHLLARSTQRGSSGAPVTPAEQTRFVQRVAKAFQTAQARGGELQLRLSPAALGSLKLELKVQNGVMEARIEAENATAKSLLVEHLPVLKERLAEQGIVVQKFDVELMDRQPQGQPDMRQDQSTPRGQRGPHTAPSRESETNTTLTPTAEARSAATDGRLNVTV